MTQTLWRSLSGPQAFTMDSNFQDHEISWGYSVISRSTGIQRVDLCCNVFVRSASPIQLQFYCLVRSLIKQLWAMIARLWIKIPKSVILDFSFLLSICVWKILFCSLLFQCRCMSIADTYCWQLNSYCCCLTSLSFLVCSVNIIIFWLINTINGLVDSLDSPKSPCSGEHLMAIPNCSNQFLTASFRMSRVKTTRGVAQVACMSPPTPPWPWSRTWNRSSWQRSWQGRRGPVRFLGGTTDLNISTYEYIYMYKYICIHVWTYGCNDV